MIQRLLFFSQILPYKDLHFREAIMKKADSLRIEWREHGLSEISVFMLDHLVCVYAESSNRSNAAGWDWPDEFGQCLEKWSGRLSLQMIDIFHDGVPNDTASWRSDRQVERRVGSIARLKPEWVSSYIYYHYQKQEEAPDSFNKTYIIGNLGRLLFSYYELPASISEPKRVGKLDTNLSPANWHEVMYPHFELWEEVPDDQRLWRRMERIVI